MCFWARADALVDFAEANGIKLRGHTLVWHQHLTLRVPNGTWTTREAEKMLEHVKTVVGRYRGRIRAWGVVNEAISDTGGYRTDAFWYTHLGSDYIGMAFRWAHEADPDVILYCNDYSAEDLRPKQMRSIILYAR